VTHPGGPATGPSQPPPAGPGGYPPSAPGGWRPPPPPIAGAAKAGAALGKGMLAAIAVGIAVVVAVVVTIVVVAPWSPDTPGGGAAPEMATDGEGRDVAAVQLPFRPAWRWELEMKKTNPAVLTNGENPPDPITWVGLNLDTAEVVEMAFTYDTDDAGTWAWRPMPESVGAYGSVHAVYTGGDFQDNFDHEDMATFVSLSAPPADVNDLENRLALEGDSLCDCGNSSSLWPGPGGWLGFKTVAGSLGYLTTVSVRESPEVTSHWDGDPLDVTAEITYLVRPQNS